MKWQEVVNKDGSVWTARVSFRFKEILPGFAVPADLAILAEHPAMSLPLILRRNEKNWVPSAWS